MFEAFKMAAVSSVPFIATEGLSAPAYFSLLEQCHEALACIETELCQKLIDIPGLSCPPPTMDEDQWESARAEMVAQAKKDAEKEKFPYEAILQLSLVIDSRNVAVKSKEDRIILSDSRTTGFQEAEKRILSLLQQVSDKFSSVQLNLGGLLLDSVPEDIKKLSSTLVKFDLSHNNLKILPESVTSLDNLTHLDIQSNQLTSLPDSIGRLVKLKVLNVSGNSLAVLPARIESCRALEELIANFNQLTRLPEELGFELLNLRKLSLHSNKLTHLPLSTSHMMSLRFLDVHMNKLGGLPEDLENLMNLEYLDLSNNFNYLAALPESIGGLTSLIELNISHNQITALPASIGLLEGLQILKVEGNPLVVPPPRVVDHSVDAIKEYMADRLRARGDGVKIGCESWLGRIASGKCVRCSTPSAVVSEDALWFRSADAAFPSISTPRRRALWSPLRLFSPRTSSSRVDALATPRRTPLRTSS